MGNLITKKIDWELACKECYTHYLVKILSFKDIILIKRYCFCGEETLSVDSFVFYFMKLKTIYYQLPDFAVTPEENINKYCYTCNKFIEDEELLVHKHKTIIDASEYIYNCKLHKNEILVGFCNSCKELICQMCINHFHNNHKIEFTKNLKITEEIINKYETNLKKSYLEMNKLLKLKYRMNDIKLKMKNLFDIESKDYGSYDTKDQQIIQTLQLLKTFIDLYKSHKNNNNIINYQIISNVLKHANFEILRIEDNKRYTNNINICFKIDLNSDKNDEQIKIISFRALMESYYDETKILKIKSIENVVYFFVVKSRLENKIIIYKNCKESKNCINLNNEIKNFIILENNSLVIYLTCKLLIYVFSKDNFNLKKEIDLGDKLNNSLFLNYLCGNNFSLLIHDKDKHTISLKFYLYPKYKSSGFLLQKSQTDPIYGTVMQIYKWVIIAIDYYVNKLYRIIILDVTSKKIKYITMKGGQTYYNDVKMFELYFNKIFISFQSYGLILNLETKQIETKIKIMGLECLYQIGDYFLASSNDYIYQFDINKGKFYNKIKLLYNPYEFTFIDLIDIGNNNFCGVSRNKDVFLFKYE